jgi:hypothetical protein
LFFGVIHGLGFSNYFKTILPGNPSEKVLPLLEFALGIEAAQVVAVLAMLILSYGVQTFFSGFETRFYYSNFGLYYRCRSTDDFTK